MNGKIKTSGNFIRREGRRKGRNRGGACGPVGYCVCTHCGEKIRHQKGIKCTTLKCPECGNTLVREELLHS